MSEENSQDATVTPVDNFRDAAKLLRRPFTPEAVKFKVQATWPKNKPTGGLIVSYIDARLVVERLNLIVPHLWHDRYEPLGRHLICHLTIDDITRQDVGEGEGKALYSDALKRAAVKFGVGVSLYAIPQQRLNKGAHLRERKDSLELTEQGEQHVRIAYSMWLEDHGIKAFGEPLDHGDMEGAQGDHEADQTVIPDGVDRDTGEVVDPVPTPPAPAHKETILRAAHAKALTAAELANILLQVGKQPRRQFDSVDAAESFAAHNLSRNLPDAAIAAILTAIEDYDNDVPFR